MVFRKGNCLFCTLSFSSAQPKEDDRFKVEKINIDEFKVNCRQFKVHWNDRRSERGAKLLPLCYLCKDAYLCMVQLQRQVKELEEIMKKFESVLRNRIAAGNGNGGNRENLTDIIIKEEVKGSPTTKASTTDKELVEIDNAIKTECENPLEDDFPADDWTDAPRSPENPPPKSPGVSSDEDHSTSGSEYNPAEASDNDLEFAPNRLSKRSRSGGKRAFACDLCVRSFRSALSLKIHISNIHADKTDPGDFPCPECDKNFATRNVLANHLIAVHQVINPESRRPVKSLQCHLCDIIIHGRGPLNQHYREAHPEEKCFTCKYCGQHFEYIRDILKHQRKHRGERPFACDQCESRFLEGKSLRQHIRIHHSGPREEFYCDICEKKFSTKGALTSHMDIHSETLIFCRTCGKGFRTKVTFKKHNVALHDGVATCTGRLSQVTPETLADMGVHYDKSSGRRCHICWEPILALSAVDKHFEENHPDHKGGPLTCQCGKTFEKYSCIQRHAIRHTQQKSIQCELCPAAFFSDHELRQHTRRNHTAPEERETHVCDICGLDLASAMGLRVHKKKHEGNQRRWVCETCGQDYAEKRGLDFHVRCAHLKILPFKCEVDGCGKTFGGRGALVKHSRKHTGVKPYKCPRCDKCFPYSHGLTRHIKQVHEKQAQAHFRVEVIFGDVKQE